MTSKPKKFKPITEEEIQLNFYTGIFKSSVYDLFSHHSDRILEKNKIIKAILIKDKNKNIYYTVSFNVKKIRNNSKKHQEDMRELELIELEKTVIYE